MSGTPPTAAERARRDQLAVILAGFRSQVSAARTIGDQRRRRAALERIQTAIVCFAWPSAAALADITEAALALAEDVRCQLHGPRIEATTVRRFAGGPAITPL